MTLWSPEAWSSSMTSGTLRARVEPSTSSSCGSGARCPSSSATATRRLSLSRASSITGHHKVRRLRIRSRSTTGRASRSARRCRGGVIVPKSEPKSATSRNLLEICRSARPPGEDCYIEITRCVVSESLLCDSLNVSVAMSVAPRSPPHSAGYCSVCVRGLGRTWAGGRRAVLCVGHVRPDPLVVIVITPAKGRGNTAKTAVRYQS
mmetsp:Transcript_34833/g.69455  ORF Transcript_34833/g.69455 Transcript_34833/m.69455 type:complete len:206 (+) Transcript_34833:667-1284(+)